jgi:hypothetical protein
MRLQFKWGKLLDVTMWPHSLIPIQPHNVMFVDSGALYGLPLGSTHGNVTVGCAKGGA